MKVKGAKSARSHPGQNVKKMKIWPDGGLRWDYFPLQLQYSWTDPVREFLTKLEVIC